MQESEVGSRPGLKTLQGQEVQGAIAGGEGLGGEEWCKAREVEVAWGTRAWASALQGSSFAHVGPRRHQKASNRSPLTAFTLLHKRNHTLAYLLT